MDLSYNPLIAKEFYNELADFLDHPKTILQKLILEGNKMGDYNCETITKILSDNNRVTYLNLS